MANQQEKAKLFHSLHQSGQPLILYNIWDPGSAQAVAGIGVKAIATGSHGVANANGYEDGEHISLDLTLAIAKRIVTVVGDLPVTMDIETGYGKTTEDVRASVLRIIASGVVGVNLEDTMLETGNLRPLDEQVGRIKAVRSAADEAGIKLFINARTDLFKITPADQHDDSLVDQALERAQAFSEAGADGFFPVLVKNPDFIKRLCQECSLPVNILYLPGTGIPEPESLAKSGVSRISYGPGPYLAMIDRLKSNATEALSLHG